MTRTHVEYADYNVTVYKAPCDFNCAYCWSATGLWIYRTRNANPLVEAARLANSKRPHRIVVSFPTDPYQHKEREKELTRKTLSILLLKSRYTVHQVYILTKNPGLACQRDRDLLSLPNVWLGTSLTADRPILNIEPYAPGNTERMEALKLAHDLGINTFGSVEPWIPHITLPLTIILNTYSFVDWFVIGRLNYETRLRPPFDRKPIPPGYYKDDLAKLHNLFASLHYQKSQFPCKKGYHIKKELVQNP